MSTNFKGHDTPRQESFHHWRSFVSPRHVAPRRSSRTPFGYHAQLLLDPNTAVRTPDDGIPNANEVEWPAATTKEQLPHGQREFVDRGPTLQPSLLQKWLRAWRPLNFTSRAGRLASGSAVRQSRE